MVQTISTDGLRGEVERERHQCNHSGLKIKPTLYDVCRAGPNPTLTPTSHPGKYLCVHDRPRTPPDLVGVSRARCRRQGRELHLFQLSTTIFTDSVSACSLSLAPGLWTSRYNSVRTSVLEVIRGSGFPMTLGGDSSLFWSRLRKVYLTKGLPTPVRSKGSYDPLD